MIPFQIFEKKVETEVHSSLQLVPNQPRNTAQGVQDIGEGVLDEVPDGTEDFLHACPCLRPVPGEDADKDIEQASYDIQHHR